VENLALVPVGGEVATVTPTRISIGTRKAFQNNYEYKYEFNDNVRDTSVSRPQSLVGTQSYKRELLA